MKTRLPLVAALAAALGSSGALAQDPRPFQPTPPPPQGSTPPPTPPTPPTPPLALPPPSADSPRREKPDRPEGRDGRDRRSGDERDDRDGRDMRGGPRMEGRRDREGGRPMFDVPAPQKEMQPFLGVVTGEIPPALGAQLGLPEGFGLLIQDVMPDSPAAAAGVQKHDVLKTLNDQQLVNPAQLATLVNAAGKDASVSLTVVRKGQEQKLTAKLGEHMVPVRRPFDGFFGQDTPNGVQMEAEHARRMAERAREFADQQRKWQEGMKDRPGRPGGGFPMPQGVPPGDVLKEARPDRGGKISVYSSNSVTKMDGSKARFMLQDNDGSIEVSVENGKRTLVAKNPNGDKVFEGPVNTDEERQKVPEQFRKKLDQIKVQEQATQSSTPSADQSGGHAEAGPSAGPGGQ